MYDYLESKYPNEGCGIIGLIKGKEVWFPCANIAEDEDDFMLDPLAFTKATIASEKLLYIVHSHPDEEPTPSPADINACNLLKISYLIISIPSKKEFILKPGDIVSG